MIREIIGDLILILFGIGMGIIISFYVRMWMSKKDGGKQ